jgi:integrase
MRYRFAGANRALKESKIGHERRAHLPAMLVVVLANLPKSNRPLFFYIKLNNLRDAWDAAITRANIQRLTPHCCRHGFITMMLRSNTVDIKTLSWLADMTPETMLKTYAHAIKDRTLTDVLTGPDLTRDAIDNAGKRLKTGTT